jgi:hypothetical protein
MAKPRAALVTCPSRRTLKAAGQGTSGIRRCGMLSTPVGQQHHQRGTTACRTRRTFLNAVRTTVWAHQRIRIDPPNQLAEGHRTVPQTADIPVETCAGSRERTIAEAGLGTVAVPSGKS